MFHTIKELEEKKVAEITHMSWSDRMDLIVYSTSKGEVALHRLTWVRVWLLEPPEEGLLVKALSWRPDGRILAIGYTNGDIKIVGIENKMLYRSMKLQFDIEDIFWVQEKIDNKPKTLNATKEGNTYMEYIDFSATYLPNPPLSINADDITPNENLKENILHEQSELNILIITSKQGIIYINIFGTFVCAEIDLNEYGYHGCDIKHVYLTDDLSKLVVTIKNPDNTVQIITINSKIFQTHNKELFAVSLKYLRISYLIDVITGSISGIKEIYESVLMEMDNKLSKYAGKMPEYGVSADFLDLLMFGICSNEMEEFLRQDLTKKGLEKLGQSIEISYSSIQKLLLKYIIKFGQSVIFHLTELRGMIRMRHRYDIMGLSEDDINAAISSNGTFLLKAGEMQQVINQSVINYKDFFRWLIIVITQLSEEQMPAEIPSMTQQSLANIAEFFQNFDHIGHKGKMEGKGFTLEGVGQYLLDSPLTIPPNFDNAWKRFLNQEECIKNHQLIFEHDTTSSLIQNFNDFKDAINALFKKPERNIRKYLNVQGAFNFFEMDSTFKTTQINLSCDSMLLAFQKSNTELHLLHVLFENDIVHRRCGIFYFTNDFRGDSVEICQLTDMKFYSPAILTMLIHDRTYNSFLVQFPVTLALDHLVNLRDMSDALDESKIPKVNAMSLGQMVYKDIEMFGNQLALSGSRKVSIVLSEHKRKVKLFEMEGEEDEDDADMSTATTKESDMVMQDQDDTSNSDNDKSFF